MCSWNVLWECYIMFVSCVTISCWIDLRRVRNISLLCPLLQLSVVLIRCRLPPITSPCFSMILFGCEWIEFCLCIGSYYCLSCSVPSIALRAFIDDVHGPSHLFLQTRRYSLFRGLVSSGVRYVCHGVIVGSRPTFCLSMSCLTASASCRPSPAVSLPVRPSTCTFGFTLQLASHAKLDSTVREFGQSASLALTLSDELSRLAVMQYWQSMWSRVYRANVINLQALRRCVLGWHRCLVIAVLDYGCYYR